MANQTKKNPKEKYPEKTTKTVSERSSDIPNVEPGFPGAPGDNGGQPEKPKKEMEPYSYVDEETCKLIAGLIPFGILAIISQNENWNLKPNEAETLAPLWDKCVAKYLPRAAAEFEPEISLGIQIALLMIGKSGILGEPKEAEEPPPETHYAPMESESIIKTGRIVK